MSVRRENIEEQAIRLRSYVSEAVRSATGATLPMTQTLDQMVRSAAKAGVLLSISTDHQSHAIEMLSNQLRLIELSVIAERDQLKSENEALRKDADKWKIVLHCMDQLQADERNGSIWSVCSRLLISTAHKLNSAISTVLEEGVTIGAEEVGDWRVTVERVKEASHE
jgi:hypothetical protein